MNYQGIRTISEIKPKDYLEVESLINWFIECYINPFVKDDKPTFVDVNYDEELDIDGEVEKDEFFEDINLYTIHLKPFEERDYLIRVVCHEMIHVKQYRLGEMIEKESFLIEYNGIDYDTNQISYDNFPWEIEAWSHEELFQQSWEDSLNSKKSFTEISVI